MAFASFDFGLSFVLEWVGLAIFAAVVVLKFPIPQLRRMMSAQTEVIRAQLVATETARADAGRLVAERTAAVERARAEAAALVVRAERNAEHLLAVGRERADGEYSLALTRANIAIDLARARVRTEVINEVGALVVAVATRVVAAELDERDHHRLIGEAIVAAESERAG
jgi:F-type H+-transporting ATPase subunit delta